MDPESTFTLPDGLRDLMASEMHDWPARQAAIPAWHPRNEGDPEGDGGDDGGDDGGGGSDDGDDDEGKTFDAAYVKKLRDEAAKYRTRAQEAEGKVKEHEDAKKSDDERKDEALTAAKARAAYADKLDVALDKAPEGMSVAQVRKLAKRLTGSTREELEADADELFADFAPSKGGDDDDKPAPKSTPRERLRPGAAPSSEPDENDPRKLAASIPRH